MSEDQDIKTVLNAVTKDINAGLITGEQCIDALKVVILSNDERLMKVEHDVVYVEAVKHTLNTLESFISHKVIKTIPEMSVILGDMMEELDIEKIVFMN